MEMVAKLSWLDFHGSMKDPGAKSVENVIRLGEGDGKYMEIWFKPRKWGFHQSIFVPKEYQLASTHTKDRGMTMEWPWNDHGRKGVIAIGSCDML